MPRIVVIHQNPNLVTTGGFETLKKNLYSGSSVGIPIATKHNKLNLELTEIERKKVEDHYNVSLDSKEGLNFYTSSDFNFQISDQIISWDLDNPETLLKYGAAVASGILAKDRKEVENPRCKALFYVYDAEAETEFLTILNELKGGIMYELTKLKKENPERLIIYAKKMFNTFEKYTPSKAYNAIIEYGDKHTKLNPTLNEIRKILDSDFEDIELSVIIQTAINSNIIIKNKAGAYINKESMTEYGKNPDEIKRYLKVNPDELGEGKSSDKVYAIRRLLKQ